MKLLLSLGVDVNARDGEGATALVHVASVETVGAVNTDPRETMQVLIDAGAKHEIPRFDGKTASDLAYSDEIRDFLSKLE